MKTYKDFAEYAVKKYSLEEIASAVSGFDSDRQYYTSIHDMVEMLEMSGHEVFLAFNMSREVTLFDYYGKNPNLYTLDAYQAFEKVDPADVVEEAIYYIAGNENWHDLELFAWYAEYCEKENQ